MSQDTRNSPSRPRSSGDDAPAQRYTAALAGEIETKWQGAWDAAGAFRAMNPGGAGFDAADARHHARPKFYCLDMFPYPSGAGLHVGHPEGYTATDIICRYKRMKGFNVLHPMGWDAFGLPAEQYAIQTGVHPAVTTKKAIDNFRRQLKRFGFSYDWSREFATIDEDYYRWTQWIFLRIYGAWYDKAADRARPIAELVAGLERGEVGVTPTGEAAATREGVGSLGPLYGERVGVRMWHELTQEERRAFIDSQRLAYVDEQVVNWCPKLGTALANEEVIDGKSERGGYPVFRKPLKQWMFKITAYAERLLKDLEGLDWPHSTRTMQQEWIGRSEGAEIDFELLGGSGGPPLRGGPARADLREVVALFDREGVNVLRPAGFVGRDPYPPDTFGAHEDAVAGRGFLPHVSMPGATYFVTWKTAGLDLSPAEMDVALSSLLHFDGERCRVYAANVMRNHVHWIVRPYEGVTLDKLAASVKHFSASEINRAGGRSGHVWDSERFDHIVRDAAYFNKFVRYVVENPREAGLTRDPAAYAWTFVHREAVARVEGREEAAAERRATQESVRVFTTRPDTIFGATYMVLAPEHAMVEEIIKHPWPETNARALKEYVHAARNRSDVDRQESKEKTGVFTGAYVVNPATGKKIPVWTADYVLVGYGTGAIMAVPGQDERDWDFAKAHGLPIVRTVKPPEGFGDKPFTGEGPAINSGFLDGLGVAEAKAKAIAWVEKKGLGEKRVNYRLRDWLFSRQRYWGEPFPIVWDEKGNHYPVSDAALPVKLPDLKDYEPVESGEPRPLLAKATEWIGTTAGAAGVDAAVLPPQTPVVRETNTMPGWAGSCWYYLRYCDAKNGARFVGEAAERYWMTGETERQRDGVTKKPMGGVDLYIGGAEHAVLHLLYARFWHKVLFDLGLVSTREPAQKLFHQGLITSFAYQRKDKSLVPTDEVEERSEGVFVERATGEALSQVTAKMSKSLKNVVNPDDVIAEYGADTFRLYEMYMGPLEASKPWNPRDIVGCYRFLQRAWRLMIDEETGAVRLKDNGDDGVERALHRTIAKVGGDIEKLAFNTAIAAMIEFVNGATTAGGLTRAQAERFALVLAPFAPHLAEEVWSRLGQRGLIAHAPWPAFEEAMLRDSTVELPVQIGGKVKARITVAADADAKAVEATALADPKVREALGGKPVKKVIVVPGKMVNVVA